MGNPLQDETKPGELRPKILREAL